MTTSLPTSILANLNGDGISIYAAAERLGCGIRAARARLLAAGAHAIGGRYRIGARSPTAFGSDRACVSTPLAGDDFKDGGRG